MVQVPNGAVVLARIAVCPAPVDISFGKIRVQLDGLPVILNGAVVSAFGVVRVTPVEERYGQLTLRPFAEIDYRRATLDRNLGIGGSAPIAIGIWSGCRATEGDRTEQ